MPNVDQPPMFAGLRVLDLTQYIAGPLAAKLMSDLGAEVIKLELAPRGDMMRHYGPPEGQSAPFLSENRGKKSVCFDFKRPEGAALMCDLVRRADILIENWTPGVLAKYGISYAALAPLNSRLIMCSLSGFGQNGPYSERPGNDLIAFAASGIVNLVGEADGPPLYPGTGTLADSIGGVHAFAAICAALYHRERTGRGEFIDLALTDALAHLTSVPITARSALGPRFQVTRGGAHLSGLTPCGIFRARDGYIAITVLIQQFETFAKLIGRPDLPADPRFDSHEHRNQNRRELIPIVEAWLQSFAGRDQPLALLQQAHILCAPVLDTEGVMTDPHNVERGFLHPIEQPGVGRIDLPAAPFRFSASAVEVRGAAPMLGEHNTAVLQELLGYSAERIAALTRAGILCSAAPSAS